MIFAGSAHVVYGRRLGGGAYLVYDPQTGASMTWAEMVARYGYGVPSYSNEKGRLVLSNGLRICAALEPSVLLEWLFETLSIDFTPVEGGSGWRGAAFGGTVFELRQESPGQSFLLQWQRNPEHPLFPQEVVQFGSDPEMPWIRGALEKRIARIEGARVESATTPRN